MTKELHFSVSFNSYTVADIQPLLQTNAIHLLINVRVVSTGKKRVHFLVATNRFLNKSYRFELDLREIK